MKFDVTLKAPKAEKIPYQLKKHGDIRIDNYYWIKEKENPEVIDYLERENDYYQRMTESSKSLKEDLFFEMKKRIKEEDESVPYFLNGFWYITRYEKGKQYPIYTRKKDSLTANEEVLFDCNKLAENQDYFQLVGINVSPDNTKVIYGIDTESRRKYTLYVKDLLTNKVLDTKIKNTTGSTAWSSNNNNFFYVKKNEQTLRSEKVFLHDISKPNDLDTLIFHEEDETFSVYVNESKSKEYIFIASYSTLTSEYQFIKSSQPLSDFKLIQKRIRNLEYYVSHFKEKFYIMNNKDGAHNFKISKTSINNPSSENWIDILEHRDHVLLEDFEIFNDHWVVTERKNGLTRLKVKRWDETEDYFIPISGKTYSLSGSFNPNFETSSFRFGYTSLSTPTTIFEYDMNSKTKKLLKQRTVPNSKFKSNNYIEKRFWADSRDGEKIPISLVYHKDTELDLNTPLLLYAYGSYGYTIDPYFSSNRLSLLDRGFIYAIAHVRGGQYLGRSWYEDGKLLNKKNTVNDFIDSTKFLIKNGISSADHIHAMGGSAGGLLMGAILNEAPFLYNSVIASVPFVDVITTMLDKSIPLTTGEYDEWGNPNNKKYYDYIMSYSPYDNVKKQDYPNIMVTSGYHDSQVQYWEPTKWVAKLRAHKTDSNVLFLVTNMEAGHSGPSGRFNTLKEIANEYAFVLQLEGKVD
ncbi:MAG: S9 family peptidase [Flavobacteriaceae bacterium]